MAATLYSGIVLLTTCCLVLGLDPSSFLNSYDIIIPQKLTRLRRDASGSLKEGLSYVIHAEGKKHILHLEQHRDLLAKDFTVYTYAENGTRLASPLHKQDLCHYQGYAEGYPESRVAISTCSGLRGLLHLSNGSYGIEPLQPSSNFQHLIYRLEDVKQEPMVCGVSSPEEGHESQHNHSPSMTKLLRRKRAILTQTRYVELFLVVDKERFDMLGQNATAVRAEMVELANYLDNMYTTLNIRIVLVGLEIWTTMNHINIDGSAGEVLTRFVQWREKQLIPRRRHDSAQFVLKRGFGSIAGMAFVGTVCSRSHAGGINVFSHRNVPSFIEIIAHELGHNLGMHHDDGRGCTCSTMYCIMNSGASDSKNFSSCSEDDFERLILNNGGRCLLNVPRPEESYTAPFCGNRLVDPGEECDCGNEKECEKDPCCQFGTCKLRSGAECANGACCQNCRFSPGGTVCRAVSNECDLPEYCNGSSPYCQPDVFIQNGSPCQSGQSYCYNGICQFYDAQCQVIFGPNAKAAAPICFQNVNSKGDRFGHCGHWGNPYKSCESRNAQCGKLQCENVNVMPVFDIEPSIIKTTVQGVTCWGVDFQLGTDVPDPAMVNEGTKCAEGKVCRDFQCVDASYMGYDCDVQNKCGGNGVCNSNKNCHCNDGWGYPDCKDKGYGGSVDSGPTYNDKDTSLRDGLLIFFLLVLPLLALGAFVFFRRNELKKKFCGRRRSHGTSHDGNREKSMNVPGRAGPTAGGLRNAPNNVPGRSGVSAGAPRNAWQMLATRLLPNTRPQRNLPNVPPGGGPAANAPPRNVPPIGPNRNIPPSSYESSYQPYKVAVSTYAVRQPQHTPSRTSHDGNREKSTNVPGRAVPTAGETRNAPNNVPGRSGLSAGAQRNVWQVLATRLLPNTRPQRNLLNVPPGGGPAANAPPRNVPPIGPNRNIPPSSYESSYQPNKVAVSTYAVRQPQHTPSRTSHDGNREKSTNVPGRAGPTAGETRNAPNNVPDRSGVSAGAPRNASQMQATRIPPNTRPQRNLPNVPPGGGPAANAPPRNVPPIGPNRNIPPSSYESSYQPNNVAVPTYAVRQPQHTPSRPPLPHQRDTAHPNIAPARPPPAPPV
ncbi:disintegrin and metalloproteinase domain-containing protein 9 isoform X2 [Hyla sarda]|uniref:disintegrin and metalloproteinase domain-containing protein 9 isoform X2 n=1 Tax=Hyla sarda TaxID=327740 RepID=UPI0024C3CFBC|nr:disintegrin and metalloproteinase domain-containing protein 9 isoform X2 [Hyla sarda]